MSRCCTKMGKPMMSLDMYEAKRRVITLYRSFYRAIPYILQRYDIAKSEQDLRWKLREKFYKNAFVTDVRVVDILIIKGYIELQELMEVWQQKGHLLANWEPTIDKKPCDFLHKFLNEKI